MKLYAMFMESNTAMILDTPTRRRPRRGKKRETMRAEFKAFATKWGDGSRPCVRFDDECAFAEFAESEADNAS